MDRGDITFWLSIAGFATSSVLAVLKGVEFFGSRRVAFTADVRLTSSEDVGNTITLLNKSNVPATISYFELVWVEPRKIFGVPIPFTQKITDTRSPVEPSYGYDESVAPHATHTLSFTGEDHYEWGDGAPLIYLKMWLVGRKSPIWLVANRTR
jgi:hypothetical protein